MDMRFKEMDRIAVNINSNDEFDYFNSTSNSDNSYKMVKELEKYKSGNEFMYDIIYYRAYQNETNDKIISSQGEMKADMFFKYMYRYEDWGKDEFQGQIKNMNMRIVRPMEPVWLDNKVKTNIITCIYPLPINATRPAKVAMFMIEENVLDKLIRNALRNYNGYVYVLDENNRPIFNISEDYKGKSESDILKNIELKSLDKKINNKKVDGVNYSIVKVSSNYNRWTYMTVIPTNQLMSKVYLRTNLFNLALCIVIIIGTVIALWLAIQNYKPLHKLIEKVSVKSKQPYEHNYLYDIEYIADVIDQIREKNIRLLKDQFFLNLLHGRYETTDEIASAISETELHFGMSNFIVCIVFIEEYEQFVGGTSGAGQDLIRFNIADILEEMTEDIEEVKGFTVEMNDNKSIALILNCEHYENIQSKIMKLFFELKEVYKQYYHFTIGVGNVYHNLEGVKESFSEAKKAAYYRLVKGKDNVIFYNEVKESEKIKYKYPVNIEAALIRAIKLPDIAGVEEITLQLKNYILCQKIHIEGIHCICYGIISSVIKIIDDMNMDASDFIGEEDYLLIQTFDTVESMIDWVTMFCLKICEYKVELKENKNNQLKQRIIDIVTKCLNDNMLSLESIADECKMSTSYISRYFKQQTGESIMQYVDKMRMDEVKTFLKNTNLKLKEILNKVGYIDEANFIRKFKKLEGVTPMKYRAFVKS
jgi:AraC-like DNA-binding protein